MAKLDPAQMTITEAAVAIEAGQLKPSALVGACLERTQDQEPDIGAWAYSDSDQAQMAARLLDTHHSGSNLHGIPFGVKDIIDTADMPTEFGSPIFHGNRPARDAACVALLKEAGSVCFGKTVTTELAHFHPGKTRNPYAATHTPGGSSSGSAAAVAACMVPFALGTQTTGSVLRPASYCGVYGFKPSFGDISRSGVFECSASFDTLGWFARSVADLDVVRRALIRVPASPLKLANLSQLHVGLFRGAAWSAADPNTQEQIESTASQLRSVVGKLEDIEPPAGFDAIAHCHKLIAGFEFARAITWERTNRGQLLSRKLLEGRCEDGLQCSYDEYVQAQAVVAEQRTAVGKLMRDIDVLLTPVAPGEAWEGLQATGDPVFNTAWTALHLPAMSIPAFKGPTGLPVGLQLVGGFRQDEQLLAAATEIQAALGIGTVRAIN